MADSVFSPAWFFGKDIIIDLASATILLLIAFFSLKYYKLSRKHGYLLLSISFFLIALSFIFKSFMNFTLYYNVVKVHDLGYAILTVTSLESSDIIRYIGLLFYRLMTLIGFFMLYSIYEKQTWRNIALFVFFIFALTYFSEYAYFVFHLTSLCFLALITYHHAKTLDPRRPGAALLIISFATIAISQVVFMFVTANKLLYVLAELMQLIGYVSLLFAFITVVRHGKKKNKN